MSTSSAPKNSPFERLPSFAVRDHAARGRRPFRILLVEDEASLRHVVLEFLRAQSFDVETAAEGVEALRKFRSGQFDLVIADRSLPRLNGDRLARLIKRLAPGEPVIQLTGLSPRPFSATECPAGVDRMLGKPFRLASLLRTIEEVLDGVRQPPSSPRSAQRPTA